VKVLLSWIREHVGVPGTAEDVGARMSMRGLALEGIEKRDEDAVLDFDVTANRPDCLSIRGIAREIATAYGLPLGPAVQPQARLATVSDSRRGAPMSWRKSSRQDRQSDTSSCP
jgi:phenylalanyl-tRNA synthetase beta chain